MFGPPGLMGGRGPITDTTATGSSTGVVAVEMVGDVGFVDVVAPPHPITVKSRRGLKESKKEIFFHQETSFKFYSIILFLMKYTLLPGEVLHHKIKERQLKENRLPFSSFELSGRIIRPR